MLFYRVSCLGLTAGRTHIFRSTGKEKISPIQSNLPFRAYHEGTPDPEHEDDELAKLGGKTRLISQKDYSKSPSPTSQQSCHAIAKHA